MLWQTFESLVNTEGIQTKGKKQDSTEVFESLVNTEGIQTVVQRAMNADCLRVLLIRKEFKHKVGSRDVWKV